MLKSNKDSKEPRSARPMRPQCSSYFCAGPKQACALVLALLVLAGCRQLPPLDMTCQFNFQTESGACSFINASNLEGKGCVKVEVLRFEGATAQAIEATVLCAERVPPRGNVTRPLDFSRATIERCRPLFVKTGKGKERELEKLERCRLQLSVVKKK